MRTSKVIILIICLASAAHISYAQSDTILKYPYLYYYNWVETGVYHDSVYCSVKDYGFPIGSEYYNSWLSNVTETAVYQHTDTPLEVIGIAFNAYHQSIYPACNMEFYLRDSNMNEIYGGVTPGFTGAWWNWRTDTAYHSFILPGMYQVYSQPNMAYQDEEEIVLKYYIFDKPVIANGDFWIGWNNRGSSSGSSMVFNNTTLYLVYETHEEPYHIDSAKFRLFHDSVWTDDSKGRHLPEIFPIINPQCNYVDSMTVTTDGNGCAYVWWDNVPLQSQWQVNITGWNLDYTETVDTNYWHYCGLIPNYTYEIKIRSRCTNLYSYSWSEWSPAVQTGHYTPQSLESPQDVDVTIVPNPATDAVTVSADATLLTLELRDLLGRTVLTQQPSANSTTVDVSTLPAGTYILRLHTPQGVATKKLVVK